MNELHNYFPNRPAARGGLTYSVDVPWAITARRSLRWRRRARRVAHNVIAHPLLVLCPPIGRWLHARTAP